MSEMLEPKWTTEGDGWEVRIDCKDKDQYPILLHLQAKRDASLFISMQRGLDKDGVAVLVELLQLYLEDNFRPVKYRVSQEEEIEAGFDYQEWGRKVYALGLEHGEKRAKDDATIEAWIEEAKRG